MKKIRLGFLFLIPTLLIAGCGKNNNEGGNSGDDSGGQKGDSLADHGYGKAKDGAEFVGDWSYSNDALIGNNLDGTGKIFKDEFKENYSLSFTVKVLDYTDIKGRSFGGYAYYKDAENSVEFNVETNKMVIQTTNGYDTQIVQALYPSNLDFANGIAMEVTKNGKIFEFYLDNKLVTSVNEDFIEAGQFGMITNRMKVEYSNVSFQNLGEFVSRDIENDIYTPAAGTSGTWEIDGSHATRVDEDPATAKFESVVFNSAIANNYTFNATIQKGVDIPGGYNLYGIIAYYRNNSNYVIVFFKDIYIDVYVMLNGVAKWTQGLEDPNLPESGVSVLKVNKVGPRIDAYINGAFVRTIESESYNAPGSVGFDTNGAGADFHILSLKTINSLENSLYDPSLMVGVSHSVLLDHDGLDYTTVDKDNDFGPVGTNYGLYLYTYGRVFGNSYKYDVTVDTQYLASDPANTLGIVGGRSDSSNIAMLLKADGTVDLYGSFLYQGENKEYIEVAKTFAGLAKDVPDNCKTNGVLNQKIKMSVEYKINEFKFLLNDVEIFKVTAKTFNITWPGIIANYVGAGFSF